MFLTVGIVPIIVGTIAFLPKSRIPWPLPENYNEGRDSLTYYVQKRSLCTRNIQSEYFSLLCVSTFTIYLDACQYKAFGNGDIRFR